MPATVNRGLPAQAGASSYLFQRWRRHGDRRARDELIERFLPLARKLARRYVPSSEPYEDLVQVASLYCHKDTDHPFARIDPLSVPAFNALGIDIDDDAMCADLEETRSMSY